MWPPLRFFENHDRKPWRQIKTSSSSVRRHQNQRSVPANNPFAKVFLQSQLLQNCFLLSLQRLEAHKQCFLQLAPKGSSVKNVKTRTTQVNMKSQLHSASLSQNPSLKNLSSKTTKSTRKRSLCTSAVSYPIKLKPDKNKKWWHDLSQYRVLEKVRKARVLPKPERRTEKLEQRSLLLIFFSALPSEREEQSVNYWKFEMKWSLFFAGGCLGWSRAERPSVSWTKVLETLCLQQPKEMLNIKFSQKHAKGHWYQQSPNTGQRMQSLKRAQRRGLRWNPKESTYARVGRCNQRKRALVKPEGSTYTGARSAR